MARLTVRLPDSLHKMLEARAQAEGVSKNQYIVYALTQVTSLDPIATQRARYAELLRDLEEKGTGDGDAIVERFLKARRTKSEFLPPEAPCKAR